jgi:hypothetical protein
VLVDIPGAHGHPVGAGAHWRTLRTSQHPHVRIETVEGGARHAVACVPSPICACLQGLARVIKRAINLIALRLGIGSTYVKDCIDVVNAVPLKCTQTTCHSITLANLWSRWCCKPGQISTATCVSSSCRYGNRHTSQNLSYQLSYCSFIHASRACVCAIM